MGFLGFGIGNARRRYITIQEEKIAQEDKLRQEKASIEAQNYKKEIIQKRIAGSKERAILREVKEKMDKAKQKARAEKIAKFKKTLTTLKKYAKEAKRKSEIKNKIRERESLANLKKSPFYTGGLK